MGAQQSFSAGSLFRDRYLAPAQDRLTANLTIDSLSQDILDSTQTYILSFYEEYTIASAQAFMQGLYPPVNATSSQGLNPMSILTNGTIIDFPLGGYQYPQVFTASPFDPNSIYIAGDTNCSAHSDAASEYFNSSDYSRLKSTTQGFYDTFKTTILAGIFDEDTVSYDYAYLIYDYLKYGFTHNQTIKDAVSATTLSRTRALADEWMYHVNGNTSAGDPNNIARTVAGRTMTAQVINSFLSNVQSQGEVNKLTLLFGSFEPMMAFASLAQLPTKNQDFYSLPEDGSSMVFEMYSVGYNNSAGYPGLDELNVRFFFRNGTNSSSPLTLYPLFGRSDSQTALSFTEFTSLLNNITISYVGDWCSICGNQDGVFCPFYTGFQESSSGSRGSTGLKPAVAGVIGALVTLAVIAILIAFAMTLGGIRFTRKTAKRKSDLGGFKAGEKLPSDLDLPSGRGSTGLTTVGETKDRVSSWELAERRRTTGVGSQRADSIGRPSFEADDDDLHLTTQPTKIEERV